MAPDLFRPDGARAEAFANALRLRLAGSFAHLLEAAQGHVALDEAAIGQAIATIRASRAVRPALFAVHRECVAAARDHDLAALRAAFDAFCAMPISAPAGLVVRAWGDGTFSEAELSRYQRAFGDQDGARIVFARVPPAVLGAARQALGVAQDVLRTAAPALASEVAAVVREVVLAGGCAGPGATFDGVTALDAWGALLLNAAEHSTVPGALAGLVHESAHAFMLA